MEVTNICILLNEKQDLYPLLDVDTSKVLKLNLSLIWRMHLIFGSN